MLAYCFITGVSPVKLGVNHLSIEMQLLLTLGISSYTLVG